MVSKCAPENMLCFYLLSRCRSARRQTGRHRLVPGRWRSQGGSARLTYGSPKPACGRCSPSPPACRDTQREQELAARWLVSCLRTLQHAASARN